MKFFAILLMALTAMLSSAGTTPTGGLDLASHPQAALAPPFFGPVAQFAAAQRELDGRGSHFDGALMLVVAGALVSLQLRRRQKSLRMPRLLSL